MSFDKSGKNTGSRRKARECALQMMFAADVVGPGEFSATRYWAELGFDEVQKGAGALALEFRDEIEKLAAIAEGFRTWLKKADPLEKSRKRTEWTRGFTSSVEALRRSFTVFIEGFVGERKPSGEGLTAAYDKAAAEFETVVAEFQSRLVDRPVQLPTDERSQFSELRSQGNQILGRVRDHLRPELNKLIAAADASRPFANKLVLGSLENLAVIDDRIRTRAEHWRIERMAIVDRNVLRLAVYEFLYEDTPHTVVINEALEIARRFSTFEATQFINGILDAIKLDLEKETGVPESKKKTQSSST